LLRYDKESAQRTRVIDDHADYYTNNNTNWMTQQEEQAAAERDEQRHDGLHKRRQMQLNIDL
jgi:hypothetical protein